VSCADLLASSKHTLSHYKNGIKRLSDSHVVVGRLSWPAIQDWVFPTRLSKADKKNSFTYGGNISDASCDRSVLTSRGAARRGVAWRGVAGVHTGLDMQPASPETKSGTEKIFE
jgi:hypothetical protein